MVLRQFALATALQLLTEQGDKTARQWDSGRFAVLFFLHLSYHKTKNLSIDIK
jgi:hypothetical protein